MGVAIVIYWTSTYRNFPRCHSLIRNPCELLWICDILPDVCVGTNYGFVNMKCYDSWVWFSQGRYTYHVTISLRPTQDIHHVNMGRVQSIHATITLLRPKQCVCGNGYKWSKCNNNIQRLRCTWYYQVTLKHELLQPYNISCFSVFGHRLKAMKLRSADCRVWNVAFGFFFLKCLCMYGM
jgi:hypothetical protein